MNGSIKSKVISFFKSGDVGSAIEHLETAILDTVRGAADAVIPAPLEPLADTVMQAAEKGITDATHDALTGNTSAIVADLERDGTEALAGIAQGVESVVHGYLPGPLGAVAESIVRDVLQVLEAKVTGATAPAIAAAQAKQIASRASSSPTAAAAALSAV